MKKTSLFAAVRETHGRVERSTLSKLAAFFGGSDDDDDDDLPGPNATVPTCLPFGLGTGNFA